MDGSMRVEQPDGRRGSLRWIQRAVNERAAVLDAPILAQLSHARSIEWRSPLVTDGFAEYRDAAFLTRVGLGELASALAIFWPARGPQWDALGVTDKGDILLVEAKAHVREMLSPGSAAGAASRTRIAASLDAAAKAMNAAPARAPWIDCFYQLANRLAHLHFLRAHGVSAWLVLANFVGDTEMSGPGTAETWDAAYEVALHAMGLARRHPLAPFVIKLYPDVAILKRAGES